MDFQLTDEQNLLADTTRDLLSGYDTEKRNKMVESESGFDRQVWGQLAEIGVLGLGFDEDSGGQIEIMVVLNEIGRRLAPEPVLHGALAPGAIIAEQGTDAQRALLDDVAAGQRILAFAHFEPGLRGSGPVKTTATRSGDGWVLSGTKNPVLAGDVADTLVVSAALPDGGTGLFLVDAADGTGVARTGYRTFDGQRGAQILLDSTPAEPLGEAVDAGEAITRALVRISAGLCAEAVGAMEESLRLTTDYLKSRKQFGVTLSKFQTLTQRAADMYMSLELARSMGVYAAMSIADGQLDPVIAARSKLQIGRSGRHISQESIQLHGGIGVTAEYPIGHYAARLTAIEHTLGSSTDQLHTLIGQLDSYQIVTL
ncbi:alkylation response protein AidB-like acyl-CoA dehydrogenase [Mycobacterium frederiksbergense]|uniref:Alkylation response protein AidB-like acyl-CoA dehydrogenase n=1 Tax=Mycolicibacterium frederiksbergense TaxID=117567 RepID=A0ABT6KXI4_9MYCO|nr:acyl-CoA dehydrogenase family protein [Mycolicibacterium frederiksbergense]MDH6195411.1 alkylation response protein AidB-like acyl-CoA dehydrogenase [Mycolicibacterium frederiksbergense]